MKKLKNGDCIIILNKEYYGELAYVEWAHYYNFYPNRDYSIIEQRLQALLMLNNDGKHIQFDNLIYKR